jgi:hypothetical protein
MACRRLAQRLSGRTTVAQPYAVRALALVDLRLASVGTAAKTWNMFGVVTNEQPSVEEMMTARSDKARCANPRSFGRC